MEEANSEGMIDFSLIFIILMASNLHHFFLFSPVGVLFLLSFAVVLNVCLL